MSTESKYPPTGDDGDCLQKCADQRERSQAESRFRSSYGLTTPEPLCRTVSAVGIDVLHPLSCSRSGSAVRCKQGGTV